MRRAALLSLLLTAAACAQRSLPAPPVVPTAPPSTDSLIRAGCYTCLETARLRADDASGFQIAVLLALRSKELGLPFEPWITRAVALQPAGQEWPLYLDIAGVVRIDPLSGDREEIFRLSSEQRRPQAVVAGWREALQSGTASPLFRAYLDLTLACSLGRDEREAATTQARLQFSDVPLIQYRIGTCASPADLVSLRAASPEFADADLPLGRNALDAVPPDQEEALRRFAAAQAAFPASPVIAASIGDLHREREEWPEALAAYDAAVRLVPTHRDALFGRTIALSNLSRHQEAIAEATHLIDLGNWFTGGAYFWRAWNWYNLGDVAAARADVEEARSRSSSPATLVLAGMIEWRQQELEAAERDFQAALDLDRGQCEAASLQGGVRAARARLSDALASFQHAIQCFDLTIAVRRKLIDEIHAGPGSPGGKAGQAARHERAVAEALKNRGDAVESVAAIEKQRPPGGR